MFRHQYVLLRGTYGMINEISRKVVHILMELLSISIVLHNFESQEVLRRGISLSIYRHVLCLNGVLKGSNEHVNAILENTSCIVEEHTRNSTESVSQTNGNLNWIIEESASSYIISQSQCILLRKNRGMIDESPKGKNDLPNGIIE